MSILYSAARTVLVGVRFTVPLSCYTHACPRSLLLCFIAVDQSEKSEPIGQFTVTWTVRFGGWGSAGEMPAIALGTCTGWVKKVSC